MEVDRTKRWFVRRKIKNARLFRTVGGKQAVDANDVHCQNGWPQQQVNVFNVSCKFYTWTFWGSNNWGSVQEESKRGLSFTSLSSLGVLPRMKFVHRWKGIVDVLAFPTKDRQLNSFSLQSHSLWIWAAILCRHVLAKDTMPSFYIKMIAIWVLPVASNSIQPNHWIHRKIYP